MSKELKPVKVVSSPEKFICAATVELDGPFKVLYGATGLIGQRHLQHILENENTTLVAIVDPSPEADKSAASVAVPHYRNADALFEDVEADHISFEIGFLCSPTHLHVPQALQLITGHYHVFIEKPISGDSKTAREVVSAGRKAGVQVFVGHHRRQNPYLRQLKELIESDKLGRLIAFQGIWTLRKPASYFDDVPWRKMPGSGGVILTNLIHEVDLLDYLFGDIIRIYGEQGPSTRGHSVEETVSLSLKFSSGAVGTFLLSDATASPFSWEQATGENPNIPRENETCYTVLGTKGSICIPGMLRYHYDGMSDTEACWNSKLKRDSSPVETLDDQLPLALQLENIVATLRGKANPVCPGEAGVKAVRVVEALQQSLQSGQAVDIDSAD